MSDKKGFSGLDSLSTDIDDIIRENDKKIEENTEEKGPKEKSEKAIGANPEKSIRFKKVEVITGVTELGYVEITPLEEMPKDAMIVTKGAFYVLSKAAGGEEE